MAKRFFLICGGVLMLAIAWRVAVPPAHAQASGNTVVAAANTGTFVFTPNGDFYYSSDIYTQPYVFAGNVFTGAATPGQPTGKTVAAVSFPYVFTTSGDVYYSPGPGPGGAPYSFVRNVFTGSVTPAHAVSFGQLKAKYR